MKEIFIYGASGHGLVVADIAKACGYDKIIFIDDGKRDYKNFEEIKEQTHIPIALGIGDNWIRERIFNKLQSFGFSMPVLIHPSSIISSSCVIEEGSVVMPNVVLNARAHIGKGAILNTGSIVEHECCIEDFVHISPNVALAGNVSIGRLTHVGIATCVIQGMSIGEKSLIGAGSVVVSSLPSHKVCFGNPCKVVRGLFDE